MSIRTLLKLFLYAGVEKEEYHNLIPDIREENKVLLKVFSKLGAVMFFLVFIASMLSHGFATVNSTTYLLSAIGMLFILFCTHFILPKHPALVTPLVYLFEITLYGFGFCISMLHTDKQAVSAVAFLLVNPLLFYDRPVRLSGLIAAVITAFCGMVVRIKAPDVAETDVWNAITFGILAVATTVFIMSIKMRALEQSRRVQYLSQTDLLTGAKNRNHYENRLNEYPELCSESLSCIYADVNGLHEMNNRHGHLAGDIMLHEVTLAMQQCFGREHTYRVGGDEFVSFQVDGQPQDVPVKIDRICHDLSKKGYHVSFGFVTHAKLQGEVNMRELVNDAETRMIAVKRDFYRQPGHDRRSR